MGRFSENFGRSVSRAAKMAQEKTNFFVQDTTTLKCHFSAADLKFGDNT